MTTTTKPGLKALTEATNIPATLVRAVVRQMGGWESFSGSAPDITRHGIDGGFNGFIYNRDTEAFARRHRADIAAMASEQAKEFSTSVVEMIQGFGCFRHGTKPTDEEIGMALYAGKEYEDSLPILNALAWYAGEEVARAYCDAFDPQPDLTEFIGDTWTIERKAGKVYVTHVGGHTVALNDPAYPSAPDFHVPDYVLRVARRMLKP